MLKPILKATRYALEGIVAAIRHERAFRQELVFCAFFGLLSFLLPISGVLRILLWGSFCMILVAELLNSGIEAIVNLVSPEFHVLAKRAKDFGAASVFLSFLYCGFLWIYVVYTLVA